MSKLCILHFWSDSRVTLVVIVAAHVGHHLLRVDGLSIHLVLVLVLILLLLGVVLVVIVHSHVCLLLCLEFFGVRTLVEVSA